MRTIRIEAAEEIQLLLPENQEAAGGALRGAAVCALGLLLVALPVWRFAATGSGGGVQATRNTQ